MGQIVRVAADADLSRAADATAYTAGDLVAGALFSFTMPGYLNKGRILALGLTITPASGNLVITALDGAVWVFHSGDELAAVADNAAYTLTDTHLQEHVARFNFVNTAWTNGLGTLVAGATGLQHMIPANFGIQGAPFNFEDRSLAVTAARQFKAAVQIGAAWTPGLVIQTLKAHLDIEIR